MEQSFNPIRDIRDLLPCWNLIANLAQRDLTVCYKRSVFWFQRTMLNPLLLMKRVPLPKSIFAVWPRRRWRWWWGGWCSTASLEASTRERGTDGPSGQMQAITVTQCPQGF